MSRFENEQPRSLILLGERNTSPLLNYFKHSVGKSLSKCPRFCKRDVGKSSINNLYKNMITQSCKQLKADDKISSFFLSRESHNTYVYHTVSPEGLWIVLGAALPMNLLTSLILANVPRAITASFPRREPYELNSRGASLKTDESRRIYSKWVSQATVLQQKLQIWPRGRVFYKEDHLHIHLNYLISRGLLLDVT